MQSSRQDVVIRDLEGRSSIVSLDKDRITLGRSSSADLCYPDDVGLSRQHLALVLTGGEWTVQDLGSKNGTLLNGMRLERVMPFRPGDKMIETSSDSGYVTAQAFVSPNGERKLLLVNKRERQFEINVPGSEGAKLEMIDVTTGL